MAGYVEGRVKRVLDRIFLERVKSKHWWQFAANHALKISADEAVTVLSINIFQYRIAPTRNAYLLHRKLDTVRLTLNGWPRRPERMGFGNVNPQRNWQFVREYAHKWPFHGFVCGCRARHVLNGKHILIFYTSSYTSSVWFTTQPVLSLQPAGLGGSGAMHDGRRSHSWCRGKAFDSVNRTFLFAKIKSFGVGDVVVQWMADYLSWKTSRVYVSSLPI